MCSHCYEMKKIIKANGYPIYLKVLVGQPNVMNKNYWEVTKLLVKESTSRRV